MSCFETIYIPYNMNAPYKEDASICQQVMPYISTSSIDLNMETNKFWQIPAEIKT